MKNFDIITERTPCGLRLTISEIDEDFEVFVDLTEVGVTKLRDILTDYLKEHSNE